MAPVWDDILGCQILVMNFIFGGSNGYCFGISMEISHTPPSYGVPSGPVIVPLSRRLFFSSITTARTPLVLSSLQTSLSSLLSRDPTEDMINYKYIVIEARKDQNVPLILMVIREKVLARWRNILSSWKGSGIRSSQSALPSDDSHATSRYRFWHDTKMSMARAQDRERDYHDASSIRFDAHILHYCTC